MAFENPDKFKKMNPLQILKEEMDNNENENKIDLPSFDLLFERFVNGDFGSERMNTPRTTLQLTDQIIEFIKLTDELKISLNKE